MIAQIDPGAGRTVTLGEIEKLSARYEDTSTTLEEMLAALEADLDAVKRKHLRGLKHQAGIVAAAEAELRSAVEAAPHLFKKPRTLTMHGVKVGFSVSEGKLVWDDEETVVALIKKHFPDQEHVFLRTCEEPNKDALKLELDERDLKRIGCRIEGAGDVVLVKRTAGDVEKLIDKLKTKLVEAMVEQE
jgi:hypothetical protein